MPESTEGSGGSDLLDIGPSILSGMLKLPPSKSHSMRWLTLASMDKSPTRIEMWEVGEDVQAMIDCLTKLGIVWDGSVMTGGEFKPPTDVLDCKNSGTALRFLIAQSASCDFPITLDGDASLRARSSLQLIESLGINVEHYSNDSEYPLKLKGPFDAKSVLIDVSKTSQFHSALMLMAPRTNGFTIATKGDAVSRKHSELTWDLCQKTGAIKPGIPWIVKCPDVVIPSDASMMAFAKLAGLGVENGPDASETIGHDLENKFLRDSNDLITPMTAWLALGEGGTISGAKHAAFKESNRITKTAELLSKFGITSTINEDGITVPGGQQPIRPKGIVETYGDHRIQMTAILLASKCGGMIEGANLHKVAWPSFLEQLISLGLNLNIQP
jgi:3-phosphoshikimate 1-carboxyvinyltransferase|tara:strand:- start:662 stop:1816 length:1155 start_codon:yes stop_codon:yes gene_type:complete